MPYSTTITDIQVQAIGVSFVNNVPATINITGQEVTSTGALGRPFSYSLTLSPAQVTQVQNLIALAANAYKSANGI